MNSAENSPNPERQVYILRTWCDPDLRGQVQHVGTGRTYPLRDPEALLALIREQVELACSKQNPPGLK